MDAKIDQLNQQVSKQMCLNCNAKLNYYLKFAIVLRGLMFLPRKFSVVNALRKWWNWI